MVYFIPLPNTKIPELAKKFLKEIWRLHGIPKDIISDRDSRFTGYWWQTFCNLIKIRTQLLTSFHPETDGQTEKMNPILE
jgi:hypothetical protein